MFRRLLAINLFLAVILTAGVVKLRRDALACEEWNLLNPDAQAQVPYVTEVLEGQQGPVVAVSDWIRAVPDQIARWVPAPFTSLGTDGFGFSDTRPAARRFFNTDAESQVVAVLEALARDGEIDPSVPVAAARQYRIDDVQAAPEQTSDPGVA